MAASVSDAPEAPRAQARGALQGTGGAGTTAGPRTAGPKRLAPEDARNAAREVRRRRLRAFLFVAPLLVFIMFAFVAPIATMLMRSAYNPTVADLVPASLEAIEAWDGEGRPSDAVRRRPQAPRQRPHVGSAGGRDQPVPARHVQRREIHRAGTSPRR